MALLMHRMLLALSLASALSTPALAQTGLPTLQVTSTTFSNGGEQPQNVEFAGCGGANISPELRWAGAPAGTKSFVVTEFDRDARAGIGFWHWLLVDIPASVTRLPAGGAPPPGAIAGMTDHGLPGYQGPCPPVGDLPHHYIFTVSALDIPALPGMTPTSTGAFVAASLRGHIIAQGSIIGTFAR